MPQTCAVQGCTNRSNKAGCENISFHHLPLSENQVLKLWVIKTKLPHRLVNKNTRICSAHFVGGKRNHFSDVPELFPWTPSTRKQPPPRNPPPLACALSSLSPSPPPRPPSSPETPSAVPPHQSPPDPESAHLSSLQDGLTYDHDHTYCIPTTQSKLSTTLVDDKVLLTDNIGDLDTESCTSSMEVRDDRANNIGDSDTQSCTSSMVSASVQCSLLGKAFGINNISDDNGAVHFYTGLPDYQTFLACFDFLGPAVNQLQYWYGSKTTPAQSNYKGAPRALTPLNDFFLVMCRLRLGLLEQDLAYRFQISQSTVSRICVTWINLLFVKFKEIPLWPTRDGVDTHMPQCFREDYPSTRCIIDATEIFIQQPSSPVAQQLTFSSYKNHNTLKAIVGITPSGAVCFVSKMFGGCVSDKELTIQSGILEMLEPGDSVMADRGFTIADLLAERGVELNIPPMKLQPQLTENELVETRRIASVRIHVERAIGRLKNYHILHNIPNSMAGLAERMFFVCTIFTNFLKPLV